MPRKKRTSTVLEKVEQRILSLRSLDPNLHFEDELSLNHLVTLGGQLQNQLDQYNTLLTDLDSAKDSLESLEKTVRENLERLVSAVASRYGKDSREYEMAGGVRKSDRIRKATVTRLKAKPETTAEIKIA